MGKCAVNLDLKDRQRVSVYDLMHVQSFGNPDVICTVTYVTNMTKKC